MTLTLSDKGHNKLKYIGPAPIEGLFNRAFQSFVYRFALVSTF